MKIVKWGMSIILGLLIVVLILDNRMQVTFNFYGLYSHALPLIVLCFIFFLIGLASGLSYKLLHTFNSKRVIKNLRHELEQTRSMKHQNT